MIIKALKTFSDGVIAMHEGEIANVPDTKAQLFIAEGYAVEYTGEGGDIDLSAYAKKTDLEPYAKSEDIPDTSKLSVINISGVDENFIIPSACKSNWTPSTTSGASYTDGTDYKYRYTSNLISGQNSKRLKMNIKELPNYFRVVSYDDNGIYKGIWTGDYSLDTDGYLTFTAPNNDDFVILLNIEYLNWDYIKVATVENFGGEEVAIPNLVLSQKTKSQIGYAPNFLQGKKWAVCGDSFTAGIGVGTLNNGLYKGKNAVYPFLIANRNEMIIQDLSMGGRTLAKPASGSFNNTLADNYTTIASDVDYITIYLGINDSHHRPNATGTYGEVTTGGEIPIGTITDATINTFYGAWNVILPWLITNRQNAKIGIIVSNGCEIDDYRVATIECAKKWGIPYIDLNGDERTPVMIRSTNSNIVQSVRNARTDAWKVSDNNFHPNEQAHAYESTIIENFLRSL